MPTAFTHPRDNTHLQAFPVRLRVGINGARSDLLQDAKTASATDRFEARFQLPAKRRARILHLLLKSPRAGAAYGRAHLLAYVSGAGVSKVGSAVN